MNQEAYGGTLQIRRGLGHERKKYSMALSQTTSIKGMSQERSTEKHFHMSAPK